jgi:large subunit ribosomal protein L24
MAKMKIRSGDEVLVISGKDRVQRKRGKVIGVLPKENRIIVDGVNLIKRAVRQSQKVRQGGIVSSPAPIDVSNVMLVCPACDAPTRIAIQRKEDGTRVRYCKRCKKSMDD